ncbi:phosphatase PAP2 family protein [Microbacterium sp. SSW1-59]|uniref:phosphatase PAP2 family protein n=1 Tax=Microbacterium xanthum TaxID=3079794 RepID=UPI002AD21780|nr:phosphatase PAP2 family protein [Microbacterium sp. SSW1-59]MDZ8200066.1 phosphatase PAP2 family protein [Microbacterium sp. SSW1-59]
MSSATPVRAAVWTSVIGVVLIAVAVGLGAWAFARGNTPFAVDLWWNDLLVVTAIPLAAPVSYAMNFLGGGWFGVFVVPLGGAAMLLVLRRPWAAVFFLAAEAASAVLVQVLKSTFGRARPTEILVMSDYGSYPSGHVANAATLAVCAVVIFPRLAVAIVGAGWVLLMAFSRTYLHAHWLTDTVGGALVGVGAALVVAAAMAVPLAKDRATVSSRRGAH